MILHKVSARRDRTSDHTVQQTVWQNVSPCELWRHSQRKLTAIWGLGCGRKSNGQRKGEVRERLIAFFFRNSKCAGITWPLTLTLILSTPWMQADLETIVCKFGGDPAICLVEAICAKSFTDGRTDRRTDGRRTPRHCISSLEWAKMRCHLTHIWHGLSAWQHCIPTSTKCTVRSRKNSGRQLKVYRPRSTHRHLSFFVTR